MPHAKHGMKDFETRLVLSGLFLFALNSMCAICAAGCPWHDKGAGYYILKVSVLFVKGLCASVAQRAVQAALQSVRDSLIETEKRHVGDHQILAEEASEERRQREEAEAALQAVRDSLIETERSHVRDQQVLAEEVSHERRQCEEAEAALQAVHGSLIEMEKRHARDHQILAEEVSEERRLREEAEAALQAVRDSLIETERNHVYDHQILAEEVSEERGQCEEAEAQLVDLGLRSESLELSVHLQQLEQRSLADAYESLRVLTQCCVCMDAPREALLMPCKHLAMCRSCAVRVIRCPLCRKSIQAVVCTTWA
ncbi:unnamed protein product [Effrenium voratum]|nr:unnamed protein product [Effrenium voratum]